METNTFTEEQLANAFTEWDRRYRENPEDFMNTVDHLLKNTSYLYGKSCSVYLLSLLNEQKGESN